MEFFSGGHLIIILVVLLLVFGDRLPGTMRSLGKSVSEFKKGMNEGSEVQPAPQYRQAPPQPQQSPAPQQAQGQTTPGTHAG